MNGTGADEPGSAGSAYARLRRAIVEGRYPPGSRLVEQAVSDQLSLSRTPVREALRRLEAEGLVQVRRHHGAVVPVTTPEDVRDLYELRARLESYAAESAAARAGADDLTALAGAAGAFEAAAAEARRRGGAGATDRTRALQATNSRFHQAVVAAARHERLQQLLARTVDDPLVYRAFQHFDDDQLARSVVFHELILGAIVSGEGDRAGRLMSEHILLGRDRLLSEPGGTPIR